MGCNSHCLQGRASHGQPCRLARTSPRRPSPRTDYRHAFCDRASVRSSGAGISRLRSLAASFETQAELSEQLRKLTSLSPRQGGKQPPFGLEMFVRNPIDQAHPLGGELYLNRSAIGRVAFASDQSDPFKPIKTLRRSARGQQQGCRELA